MNSPRSALLVAVLGCLGCPSLVSPRTDAAGTDAAGTDAAGTDAAGTDALGDREAQDAGQDAGTSEGGLAPCGVRACRADEVCVHQGFVEDGGFRECDLGCGPASRSSPATCDTVGGYYCRLQCLGVDGGDVYCLCE